MAPFSKFSATVILLFAPLVVVSVAPSGLQLRQPAPDCHCYRLSNAGETEQQNCWDECVAWATAYPNKQAAITVTNNHGKIDCMKYCGPNAQPRDYLWCYVDCGRPVGISNNRKRAFVEECTQNCGKSDLICYNRCMGIPDPDWIANGNTESCISNCDMLPSGKDYSDCTASCVTSTYLAGNIVPSDATNQTATTLTETVLWAALAETVTSTLGGSTQTLTFQSIAVAHPPSRTNGSSTTECPTFIAGFTNSSGLENSLATPGPTDKGLHVSSAGKQIGISYCVIVTTLFSGLIAGLIFGML